MPLMATLPLRFREMPSSPDAVVAPIVVCAALYPTFNSFTMPPPSSPCRLTTAFDGFALIVI